MRVDLTVNPPINNSFFSGFNLNKMLTLFTLPLSSARMDYLEYLNRQKLELISYNLAPVKKKSTCIILKFHPGRR